MEAQVWVVAQGNEGGEVAVWKGAHASLEAAKAAVEAEVASWNNDDPDLAAFVEWDEQTYDEDTRLDGAVQLGENEENATLLQVCRVA